MAQIWGCSTSLQGSCKPPRPQKEKKEQKKKKKGSIPQP